MWLAVSSLPPCGDVQAWAVGAVGAVGHPGALLLLGNAPTWHWHPQPVTAGIPAVWLWMLLKQRVRGQCFGWLLELGAPILPAQPISRGAGCVCTLCCQGNATDIHVQPCPSVDFGPGNHIPLCFVSICPSLGFMTPEGLRLMRKSCPPRPCSAAQSSRLLHCCLLCFYCGAQKSPSCWFLRVTGWYY